MENIEKRMEKAKYDLRNINLLDIVNYKIGNEIVNLNDLELINEVVIYSIDNIKEQDKNVLELDTVVTVSQAIKQIKNEIKYQIDNIDNIDNIKENINMLLDFITKIKNDNLNTNDIIKIYYNEMGEFYYELLERGKENE